MNKILKAKIIEIFGTQADFAMEIGEDESRISRVVRNRRKPTNSERIKYAKFLKCKPIDIFPDFEC